MKGRVDSWNVIIPQPAGKFPDFPGRFHNSIPLVRFPSQSEDSKFILSNILTYVSIHPIYFVYSHYTANHLALTYFIVCLSVCLSIYLSIYLSICLCLSMHLSLCLSISISVSICMKGIFTCVRPPTHHSVYKTQKSIGSYQPSCTVPCKLVELPSTGTR